MKKFIKLLVEAFLGIHGNYLVLLGLTVSFFCWFVLPNEAIRISNRWLFIVLCVFFIFLMTSISFAKLLIDIIDKNNEEIQVLKKKILPEVLRVYIDTIRDEVYIILAPSDIFSFESSVGLYCLRDVFEVLFGYGIVSNIQQDKCVQIKIISIIPGYESIFSDLRQQNSRMYSDIIIKPHYPLSAIPALSAR
ncbi:hypothetical protein [Solidesulfovibrio sp. C21]|uniref:hypothetical protein n=1 Tax=Solidesulfovibrio sp. C21 TaxID=3398613 RepID=UPI0039FC8C9A